MIRRYGYIFLALVLLLVLSISDPVATGLRSLTIATIAPSWRHISNVKELFLNMTTVWPTGGYHTSPRVVKELEMIRLENYQLKSQLELLKAELSLEKVIEDQVHQLMHMTDIDAYAQRRKQEIFRQLELYSHAITARIIFQENGSWKSSVWVNVGEETNQRLKTRLIEKNSPVVIGTTVIGLVDYVGKSRSRVRFITDRALNPSVRAIRGEERSTYLAKGEVQGMRYPLWRSRGTILRGLGFNYDFEDVEGPSRDLRTGKAAATATTGALPLIQVGDAIITTGMDGLFPAGLRVGVISKVYPLKEGSCSYEADIQSYIEEFESLSFLTILPSLSDPSENI
jgi:rod shape-determining protein MreC